MPHWLGHTWEWLQSDSGKSHAATQGAAGLFSFATQSSPASHLLAICVGAGVAQLFIFIRGEIEAERAARRHREQIAADVAAWSGYKPPVPPRSEPRAE